MSRRIYKVMGMVMILVLALALCSCGGASKVSIDYGDAESFEAALNAGENLEGKVVRFRALELHPDSAAGYDVWAGEHLNFISSRNPDIKAGDTVVVRATEINSSLGSWFINYEKISNAEVTDATITSEQSTKNDGTVSEQFDQIAEQENTEAENPSETIEEGENGDSTESSAQTSGVDPDLKTFLDSYEEFIDEYVVFMKKYMADPLNAVSMLSEYSEIMSKYADFAEKVDQYDSKGMSTEDAKYYLEVTARCSQKMLEIYSD